MTDAQEARQTELLGKETAGTITDGEKTVLVALNDLDERTEVKATADKTLADAIAAETPPVVPQPVVDAQAAVVAAQSAEDVAQKAYDDAEAALAAAPVAPVV